MAFKSYPQPPFKKFVKVKCGKILEPDYKNANIEPAVYNKRGCPLFRFGWEITWGGTMTDKEGNVTGFIDFADVIVDTADTKEELL